MGEMSTGQKNWVVVVFGSFYTIAVLVQILFDASNGLSGVSRLIGIFSTAALLIASAVVYFTRAFQFSGGLREKVWNATTAGHSAKGLDELWDDIKGSYKEKIPPASEFRRRTRQQTVLLNYSMISLGIGLLLQFVVILIFNNQDILSTAADAFTKGASANLWISITALIHPIIGIISLLFSGISSSGEESVILFFAVGLPSIIFIIFAWNFIALVERVEYILLRKLQTSLKTRGIPEWVGKMIYLTVPVGLYLNFTFL